MHDFLFEGEHEIFPIALACYFSMDIARLTTLTFEHLVGIDELSPLKALKCQHGGRGCN